MNVTWTDVPALSKPARAFVFGPRVGKSFKLKKPQSNIALWVGGFRLKLNSATNGTLPLADLYDPEVLNEKIQSGYQKVNELDNHVNTWWDNLSAKDQLNPINAKKYETAKSAIAKSSEFLVAAEGAASTVEKSTVTYSLDKRPKDMWNFVVGSQYQINKHLMFRVEYGFLGSRQQFLGGIQYRFGLPA